MKLATEVLERIKNINEESERFWFKLGKDKWPIQVNPDIAARGGRKGKGTRVTLFIRDTTGKGGAVGFQGPATKAAITRLIKKQADKGYKPNAQAEGMKNAQMFEEMATRASAGDTSPAEDGHWHKCRTDVDGNGKTISTMPHPYAEEHEHMIVNGVIQEANGHTHDREA